MIKNLLPKNPALTPSYDLSLSSSTIGGGRVSLTTGGSVTGSTPQKSSVSVAIKNNNFHLLLLLCPFNESLYKTYMDLET